MANKNFDNFTDIGEALVDADEIIVSNASGTTTTAVVSALSRIWTWILTKDGAGSTLDADLLDGVEGSGYATATQGSTADTAMQPATYDAAGHAAQVVTEVDTQTLTNKTLTTPTVTLKQSATPTPTAEGDIQWDTDGDQIVIGDGAGQKTFSDDTVTASLLDTDVATHAALTETHGISAFGATVIDDANAAAAQSTLGVDPAGTDNSATHTGEVTGGTALVVDVTAISGQTVVTAVGADSVLIEDATDGQLKQALISDFASAGGDMAAATYDAATIAEQLVGLTASQTLTNKTLTAPVLDLTQSATPTPTAEGRVEWDTDGNNLAIGDGASTLIFSDDTVTASLLDTDVATHAALTETHGITAAAATVLDDATVTAMLDTLGGASAQGTGGVVRATSPTITTPAISGNLTTDGTIDGIDIATDVAANTAKTSNATHTGEVTGATALVIDVTAISGQTVVTAVGADSVLIEDATDGQLKKALVSDMIGTGAVGTDVIWDAKGDLAGGTGANTASRLAVGTNDFALVAASGETTGMKWAATMADVVDDTTPTLGGPLDCDDKALLQVGAVEEAVNTVPAAGATEALDISVFGVHNITMDENCTLSFTNPATSGEASSFVLILRGAFTPTFPASVAWPDGVAPTYATPTKFVFDTVDGGTIWQGQSPGKAYA